MAQYKRKGDIAGTIEAAIKNMCKPLNFEDQEHRRLLNRIKSGDTVLFLGAGFSLGAIGSHIDSESGKKIPLPNAKKLKEILVKELLYGEACEDSLKEICEECQEDNKERYPQLMKELFRASTIQDFQKEYAQIEWKAIYTTNVDNVIELAYEHADKDLCCIYTKSPACQTRQAVKYYKLHGDAIHAPGAITFSVTDYVVSAGANNDYRFENLSAALKTENFIFIGTSLSDEWDFDLKCLQSDIYKVANKTYFILPEYDARIIKKIKRRFTNPVFIEETAESFIAKVRQYISQMPPQNSYDLCEKYKLKRIEKKNYDIVSYLQPNLYLGAEPTWEDIFSNHDVIWAKTRAAIDELEKGKPCTLIIGKPISGKTTMLYRLGASLCESHTVLEYEGDNFIEDLQGYINHGYDQEELTILADDANWFLGRIDHILSLLCDTKIRLIATVREREYLKKQHLFDAGIREKVHEISNINRITREDIGLYLDKLNEKSFLGPHSKIYNESREDAIKSLEDEIKNNHEDPLLKLAYKLYINNTLNDRIAEISDTIINGKNYNLKRFAVLLYFLDVIGDTGLKLSLFLDIYHMSRDELEEFMGDVQDLLISNISRKSWARSDYSKINIHSRFSEIIKKAVKKINYDELQEIVMDIFRKLDSVYHFKCRQTNSYQNYVLYTLLRSQNISELFRRSGNEKVAWGYISNIYEKLHEYLCDYHLYWLHRGISEIKMREYSAASLHLEQARATRGKYSYEIEHSFAILYYEQATFSSQLSQSEKEGLLKDALKIIRLQIDRKENDAFSIHSFIVKTIQFYDKNGIAVPENLMKEMLEYYGKAYRQFAFKQSKILRNMLMCIYRYLTEHNGQYTYTVPVTQEELQYINRRIGKEEINEDILDLI